jgi:hypothetical protein
MEVRLNYLELDSITGEDLILDTTTSEELLLDTIGTRLSSNEPHLGYTKGW